MRRLLAGVFSPLFILLMVSCYVWGPADNPLDPRAENYQGFPTVTASRYIRPVSPTDGARMSEKILVVSSVLGATMYELRVALTPAGLDDETLFVKADYPTNILNLQDAPLIPAVPMYWKVRAFKDGAWEDEWSPVASFILFQKYIWTARSAAGARKWRGVTSNADGSRLAAVAYDDVIYVSSDFGATWTARPSAGSRKWNAIASNSTGDRLAAVVSEGGLIYVSDDYGSTWTSRAQTRDWWCIDSNSDGSRLVAGEQGAGWIYNSWDYGETWFGVEPPGFAAGNSVAISSDGKYVKAASAGFLWESSDFGLSWSIMPGAGDKSWYKIKSNPDGSILLGTNYSEGIYYSNDHGSTWKARDPDADWYYADIAMNSNGNILAVLDEYGYIWVSTNSGVTWEAQTEAGTGSWLSITSNDSGSVLCAVAIEGYIWTGIMSSSE